MTISLLPGFSKRNITSVQAPVLEKILLADKSDNRVQWNLSITDTVGDQNFVRYSEVSLTQGLPVYFR